MKNPEFWVKELLTIEWKDKQVSFQRAISLSLGVTKNVDVLSGMTVNLMDVRGLFERIRAQLAGQSFTNYADVLKQALLAVKSDLVIGLQLDAVDGCWRINSQNLIEEQKTMMILVEIGSEIFEAELSLWKKPNDEIRAEISHPTNLQELAQLGGAELFIEAKQQRWIF